MTAFVLFSFMMYFPYGWCALAGESRDSYGLIWEVSSQALRDVTAAAAITLVPLTALSLYYFSSRLPSPEAGTAFSQVLSGLAAAVAEETFFRGWLQTLLKRRLSSFGAIFLASALFGLAHLASPHAPFALLAFFPGLVMGFLRDRHGSVLPAILYHWIGNIWSVWFYPGF